MRVGLKFFAFLGVIVCQTWAFGAEDVAPANPGFGLETLVSLCTGQEASGQTVSALTFGDAVISQNEIFTTRVNCNPTLSAEASHYITSETTSLTLSNKPHSLQFIEGNLKGQFKITLSPAEVGGTQIDPEDIVKTNEDGSIVLKRTYHELFLVMSLGDAETEAESTHVVERFIFELNHAGQPVVAMDHFTGTVNPAALALSIGGKTGDYQSGIVIVQSLKSTLDSCVFIADAKSVDQCFTHSEQRKQAIIVGPRFQPSFVTSFGWHHDHPPTNNPISWYANRVDFAKVLHELTLNSAQLSSQFKPDDSLVKSWIQDAQELLTEPGQETAPVLTVN